VRCDCCGVIARADGQGTPIVLKHLTNCPTETARKDEPLLGLATTRELLKELSARGRTDLNHVAGSLLDHVATDLLTTLPETMLRYRTVD
jgi:hypothetical protein